MGSPRKSAPKAKAVAKKPSAKSKSSKSSTKSVPAAMTVEQKQRLLKPLTEFGDLVERLVEVWGTHGKQVRVPGLSPAKLAAKLRAAERANKKEDALRTAFEAKLQPLADARLRAEHDVWKNALDLYAMIKTAARTDPAIAKPFEFFANALTKRRTGAKSEDKGEAKSE
jgi:hypothetical protein